ncbi:hypothetical protein N0V90_009766 [Kalmusia sp. IMI 367209]|nr:hypothetical protein N0V90_009766 [Kalmusia sp. IMI 367209]
MWTTVLQTTAIHTFSHILAHHTSKDIFSDVLNNPVFSNMTGAFFNVSYAVNATMMNATSAEEVSIDFTPADGSLQLNTTFISANGTTTNGTFTSNYPDSYYKKTLPIDTFATLIVCVLQYCWLIWLERMFPARPRRRDVPLDTKENFEMSEDREEEVVKKWIAQGRVRRASLSWCNTFFKWILGLTVMRVWYFAVLYIIRRTVKLRSPKKVWKGMLGAIAMNYVTSFFHVTALAELIAFIIVPAHKQILFVASAEMVCEVFVMTVVRMFATWAVHTEFAQMMMQNITENVIAQREREIEFLRFKNEL